MSEGKRFVEVWRSRNLIDYVLADLDKRVKRDKPTKVSVFFTALSAYLPEPINLFLKGESGIGKTYNVVETLTYFPRKTSLQICKPVCLFNLLLRRFRRNREASRGKLF